MVSGKMEWVVPVLMVLLMVAPQVVMVKTLTDVQGEMAAVVSLVDGADLESLAVDPASRLEGVRGAVLTFTVAAACGMLALAGVFKVRSKRALYRLMVDLDTLVGEIDGNSFAVKTAGVMLSDDTRQQSEAVAQTARTHKQVAVLSRENASHAERADVRIKAYTHQIEEANEALRELTDAMGDIKQASEDIRKIVDDIDGISANTNLLAINAGVEAVKAGEAGRAFGVIAKEVRRLAIQSSESANKTGAFIETTVEKIDGGSATVDRVVSVFRDTVGQVAEIQKNMAAISDAARHQSEQLHGLEGTLGELETLTGRNVDNSRRSDVISGDLQKNGEALRMFLQEMIVANISHRGFNEETLTAMLREMEALVIQFQSVQRDADHHRLLGQWKAKMGRQVAAVYTCRMDGSFIYSDPPAGIEDARIRPWWQNAAAGRPYASPVYISAISRRPCYTISVPLFSENSQIAGVLGIDLAL